MIKKGTWEYKGHHYYHIDIEPETDGPTWPPKDKEYSKGITPPCRKLCGRNYKRHHFSCIIGKCWIKRVWYGKLPPILEVRPYTLLRNADRPRWKHILFRWFMTIVEWFAS